MGKDAGTLCKGSNQGPARKYLMRWEAGMERIDGECSYCGHFYALKKDGKLIAHKDHGCVALDKQKALISSTCPREGRREVPDSMIVCEIGTELVRKNTPS